MADDSDHDSSSSSCELQLESELSAATMAALQQHLAAADLAAEPQADTDDNPVGDAAGSAYVSEDFGMSQFWYDDETAERMARQMLRFEGRLGFISCPTAFRALKRLAPERADVFCFEYDRRFGQLWGNEFVFYDCHKPLDLPLELHGSFDALIADPPYLNPDTMQSFGQTLQLLSRTGCVRGGGQDTIPSVLVTGAVLQDDIARVLGFEPAVFEPRHSSNIMNRLLCYCNFEAQLFATPHSKSCCADTQSGDESTLVAAVISSAEGIASKGNNSTR